MPEIISAEAVRLGGGAACKVAILPQASELADTGAKSAAFWLEAGAAEAFVVDESDREAARAALQRATLIWMPGGSQSRLLEALTKADLVSLLKERHQQGCVIGGTSAGAAVTSEIMLTGKAELGAISPKSTETVPGLGLWPQVIVDQHFLVRQRSNRLISALLAHPGMTGVGIDEGTAVIVTDKGWQVVGVSQVMILTPSAKPGSFQMDLLSNGANWLTTTSKSEES
jgi:cyanophycinase